MRHHIVLVERSGIDIRPEVHSRRDGVGEDKCPVGIGAAVRIAVVIGISGGIDVIETRDRQRYGSRE